jgi:hypothetical protein
MNLAEPLAAYKSAIVKRWFDRVVETYPAETAHFLRSQKDPFANPVGQATQQSLQALFDLLYDDPDRALVIKAMDPVVRIRAVQSFTPSQAVGFIFELKDLLLEKSLGVTLSTVERAVVDRRIDQFGLAAFDLYMQCRERINELKAMEMRERTYKAFARAGLVKDLP